MSASLLLALSLMRAPADHIDILPLEYIGQELLEKVENRLALTFSVPLNILSPENLPARAWNESRAQYNSEVILNYLIAQFRPSRPSPASIQPGRLLAITNADLYADDLSYVFGQADIANRVAVISLARLHEDFYGLPANDARFIGRACRESIHELGHTYGLPHCLDPQCVMFFSNSLVDTDRKSSGFCLDCRRKLSAARG